MPLITLEGACLAYGHVDLLDHADFQLDAGETVALIGRNGAGKSSLLKALAGAIPLDDGVLWCAQNLSIAYVPQEPDFPLDATVFSTIVNALGSIAALLDEYHRVMYAVSDHASEHNLEKMAQLQHDIEAANGWLLHQRVEAVLQHLGLDGDVPVSSLSGGGVKRVALARALVCQPDLLLLDEPTNHLDIDAISWLENLIRDFSGAVVVITHDRVFMDNVCTRIVELDRGALTSFPGTFSQYQIRKAEQLEAQSKANARFDKLLAQEEVWIRKGIEARRTRNEGRVRRLEQLRLERAARRDRMGQVKMDVDRGEQSGKLVAELREVSKRFGEKTIIKQFSTRIMRGDRIGFVGSNGVGKTTLLKLILGEISPDEGQIRRGTRQTVAYYDQLRAQLDPDLPLTDVISPGGDYIQIGSVRKHVIGYLEDFLFSPQRARSPVSSLSGGERNRLLLARLFAHPSNVVVLDEPTNDLDIETLELLEALLGNYDGTLFLVSHDRAFLDNVVTQVIAPEGDGQWGEYAGGYSEWQRVQQDKAAQARQAAMALKSESAAKTTARKKTDSTTAQIRLSYKEKRELEQLPDHIVTLETEQSRLQQRLADPGLYQNKDELLQVQQRLSELDDEITMAMERWEILEGRASVG